MIASLALRLFPLKKFALIFRDTVLIAAIAIIPAAASALFHPKQPLPKRELAKDEVLLATVEGWNRQVLWVDARSQNHYQNGHVPGAILLNMQDWDSLLGTFLDHWNPKRKVVVYCGSDACDASREVATRLREEVQIGEVYVLKGGWEAWRNRE